MTDPLYPELDIDEVTPEDEPTPDDVAAPDEEAGEDDPQPTDDGLDVRTAFIPDDAI